MTPEYKTVPILDAARRAGVRIADGQAGRYEVKAFCPFCLGRTKNPHLYLNTEKNRFFCQRCGEHGNSVSLYAKIRGISNKEAFEELEYVPLHAGQGGNPQRTCTDAVAHP